MVPLGFRSDKQRLVDSNERGWSDILILWYLRALV